MKKIYLFAVAAMMLAACSSKDDLSQENLQQETALEKGAVGFDVYLQRNTTRAGWVGESTTTALQDISAGALGESGFGVFGYYTNNNEYDPQSLPNFFYNQQVKYDGTSYYKYEPIKYWPNEYGTNAISDDADKVSFFAYLPWVDVVPSTGKIVGDADEAKWGITGMTRNIANGDPIIKYLVSFDADKMVDLCWGVCDNPEWATINNGDKMLNGGVKGLPWLDVERPLEAASQSAATQRVKFTFKHALSQFNVTADTYADGTSPQSIDSKSRVYVRSITFTGIATKGALNLHNETPNKAQWLDYNGTSDLESGEEVTIYDGRKDGKEGTAGGIATNEKVLGLNPMFVQDENQLSAGEFINIGAEYHTGVDGTTRNMFRKWDTDKYVAMAADAPIYVIPTGEEVTVTIVYDVETPSKNLGVYLSDGKTAGSTIENRITKTVDFGPNGMENGKKYTLHLHLGMNSVKLDADISDWDSNTPVNDINLPSNAPEFVAGTNAEYNFSVPAAAANDFAVKLTGFNGGEVITPTSGNTVGAPVSDPQGAQANAAGIVAASFDIAANTTVRERKGWAMWTGNGKQVKLNITQQPEALGMSTDKILVGTDIQLKFAATSDDWSADIPASNITVTRNGVLMGQGSAAGKYVWNASTQTIELYTGEKTANNDVFVITVKAGDAPAETITCAVKTLAFSPATIDIPYQTSDPSFDVAGYIQNASAASNVTYALQSGSAAVLYSGSTFNISDVGDVTIKATDNNGTPGETSDDETANLIVHITKQDSKIFDEFADDEINNTASWANATSRVLGDWYQKKAKGAIDGNDLSEPTYTILSVKKDGADIALSTFRVRSDNRLVTNVTTFVAGTYTIKVKANYSGNDKFNSSEKEITITLTLT